MSKSVASAEEGTDVLSREAEELVVVGSLEPVSTWTVDRTHCQLLSGLYALCVDPLAPNFSAFRRVSSNFERM